MGPNVAFCCVIFGLLSIYCEIVMPGRIVPGVAGAAAALAGGYFLWQANPTGLGLRLLAVAVVFFAVDAVVRTFWIAGLLGTIALAAGFCRLIRAPHGISAAIAIPWCLTFGLITVLLNYAARQARRNKRLDCGTRQ